MAAGAVLRQRPLNNTKSQQVTGNYVYHSCDSIIGESFAREKSQTIQCPRDECLATSLAIESSRPVQHVPKSRTVGPASSQDKLHHLSTWGRGGYEKLGVVVAAYMHYSNICASTDQALDRYAMKRFFDDKIGQLYHPSQKRYVQYFAGLLSGVIRINSSPLYLHTLTMYGVPHFEPRGGCHLFIKIYQGMTPIYTSGIYNLTETMRQVTIVFEMGIQLRGDILLKAYHRRLMPASREVIFRMQFHTCAVSEKILAFTRNDLDDACNDMRFPLDGSVELFFTHSPDERPRTVSNVSCDKSPCAIASWNSYENVDFTFDQMDEHVTQKKPNMVALSDLDPPRLASLRNCLQKKIVSHFTNI
ncbi:tensin-like [Homarus americanus]|uniref:tensin-like n=1 Tax=Homarus americanus TaxID=6706 RepID=UPI001C461E9A|nr:tensin-like [Homarus americanus]